MPQRHHHLDHPGDARGSLCVTDIGLDRAQPQRPLAGTVLSVGREEGLGLDRVAQSGAGAVGLHRVDITGRQAGVGEGLADDTLLGRPVGRGQTVARTVLVDRTATHHGQDTVTVAMGVGEPLHQQHPHTLTPAGPVRRRRERLAMPVRGQTPLPRKLHEGTRRRHHRHTPGKRHRALTRTQRLTGQMQSHQRRGTSRVHRHRRTLKTKRVRDTTGDDAAGGSGQCETIG
ncbi:hypothetical protein SAV31267_088350 [Streptomyces avermitilis]|uniref:Uncharacterized protein n=1 Tax=Streptomyces avermitilis TaxID=33903 RepID=A0A4D4N4H4_STRAX|nr:hypothetical protein SAV31267_088350 [Streptomyces avermitilis]